jgi:hypothetical protein
MFEENFGSADINTSPEDLRTKIISGEIPEINQMQIVDFVPPYFSFSPNIGIKIKLD